MNGSEPDFSEKSPDRGASIDYLVQMAERELAAFTGAVNELFGYEEARVAGDEWIEELLSVDQAMGPGISDWRRITIMTSRRLASRLCRNAESTNAIKGKHTSRRVPHESS